MRNLEAFDCFACSRYMEYMYYAFTIIYRNVQSLEELIHCHFYYCNYIGSDRNHLIDWVNVLSISALVQGALAESVH